MKKYDLIIFDVDGTLADMETSELLPGVFDWFEANGSDHFIALASNQGGVGLRHWMEDGGFGEPGKFPTQEEAEEHIQEVIEQLPDRHRTRIQKRVYVCFAYQSKSTGKWAPTPDGCFGDPRWSSGWRKPDCGMLEQAMMDTLTDNTNTLMVGDSEEDRLAAKVAGVDFVYADRFFKREAQRVRD